METTNFQTIIANIRDEMSDLAPFGEELTDDELAFVSGGKSVIGWVSSMSRGGDTYRVYDDGSMERIELG